MGFKAMTEIQATEPWSAEFEGGDILRGGLAKALSSKGCAAVERTTGCAYGSNAHAVARFLTTMVVVDLIDEGEELSVVFKKSFV